MADAKVSSFPDGAPVLGTDKYPFVRSGDPTNWSATAAELAVYIGGVIRPGAGVVYSTGSALAAATIGSGVQFSSGTLSNTGVLSIDTATGALLIGAGLQRSSQTISVIAATTAALGGVIVGSGLAVSSGTLSATGTGTMTGMTLSGGTTGLTGGSVSGAGGTITVAGTLALANGGLGNVTFTSGGIPCYRGNGFIETSALLAGNALVLGGGAAQAPLTSNRYTTNGLGRMTLGAAGVATGTLELGGLTSGTLQQIVQSAAGSPVITWGTSSGTPAISLPSPLTITAATGAGAWTGLTANTLMYASGTAAVSGAVLPSGWAITSGTLVPSSTITVGLSNTLTDTIAAGTYDLGPVIQGGTVLNSYAHVASGTITYTGAIGQPGTYTTITGMSAITSSSTTIDTIGTATAANVIAAGAHLWVIIAGTPPPGGDVFFTVKVP